MQTFEKRVLSEKAALLLSKQNCYQRALGHIVTCLENERTSDQSPGSVLEKLINSYKKKLIDVFEWKSKNQHGDLDIYLKQESKKLFRKNQPSLEKWKKGEVEEPRDATLEGIIQTLQTIRELAKVCGAELDTSPITAKDFHSDVDKLRFGALLGFSGAEVLEIVDENRLIRSDWMLGFSHSDEQELAQLRGANAGALYLYHVANTADSDSNHIVIRSTLRMRSVIRTKGNHFVISARLHVPRILRDSDHSPDGVVAYMEYEGFVNSISDMLYWHFVSTASNESSSSDHAFLITKKYPTDIMDKPLTAMYSSLSQSRGIAYSSRGILVRKLGEDKNLDEIVKFMKTKPKILRDREWENEENGELISKLVSDKSAPVLYAM